MKWNNADVLAVLPHRPPMLRVDGVLAIEPGRRGVARNLISIGEPLATSAPDWSGVWLIEAIAQAGRLTASLGTDAAGRAGYLASIEDFHIVHPAGPGDALTLEVEVAAGRRGFVRVRGQVKAGDDLVAEGEVVLSMPRDESAR